MTASAGSRGSRPNPVRAAPGADGTAPDGTAGAEFRAEQRRGRGAVSNPPGRFETTARIGFDDGWGDDELPPLETTVTTERARKILTRNDSPDIGFDRSLNPYRGCEHGCVYCFARPSHAFLGLSAGLDFETKLFVKANAAEALERELSAPGYRPKVIAIGTNTDPYQPVERRHRVTRQVLEVLDRANHPCGLVTKSALVLRDLDILARMSARGLVRVAVSVTTLDRHLARDMEPRAATPMRRLDTLRRLAEAGVPTGVLVAPVIPALNDHELEAILEAAHGAGARYAGYVLLRLPHELKDVFRARLLERRPGRARHVLSVLRAMRDGKDYDSRWNARMTGTGPYARALGRRFELAVNRLGFNKERTKLRTDLFTPPRKGPEQLSLF